MLVFCWSRKQSVFASEASKSPQECLHQQTRHTRYVSQTMQAEEILLAECAACGNSSIPVECLHVPVKAGKHWQKNEYTAESADV